jgi:hypothetical protein
MTGSMDAHAQPRAGVFAAIVVALSACGGPEAQSGTAQDSDASDATAGAEAGAEAGVQKFGVINVIVLTFQAYFAIAVPLPVPAGARPQSVDAGSGSCTLVLPPTSQLFTGLNLVSAGTLTLTGGVDSPLSFSPTDAADGVEYAARLPVAFMAGSTFTITASGATVPAFSIPVRMPDPIQLTAPSFSTDPNAPPVTISRSSDLPVAWTAGTSGTVDVQVLVSGDAGVTEVECLFPESAGAGVVPASLLGQLPPGSGQLSVNTKATPTLTVDDWSIGVNAWVLGSGGGDVAIAP